MLFGCGLMVACWLILCWVLVRLHCCGFGFRFGLGGLFVGLDFLGLCGFMLDGRLRGGFVMFGDLLVLVFDCCAWFGYRFWLLMLVVLVWLYFSLAGWCGIVLDEVAGCGRVLDADAGLLWCVF